MTIEIESPADPATLSRDVLCAASVYSARAAMACGETDNTDGNRFVLSQCVAAGLALSVLAHESGCTIDFWQNHGGPGAFDDACAMIAERVGELLCQHVGPLAPAFPWSDWMRSDMLPELTTIRCRSCGQPDGDGSGLCADCYAKN